MNKLKTKKTNHEILNRQELSTQNKVRRYDLDWLRAIAILILLYYHVGMIYVSWDWHINSEKTSVILEHIMVFLHQWRMPLLFFISGAGTYYALGFRSSRKYAWERTKRLFFPVIFGMLVIVPPQIYLERIFKNIYWPDHFNTYWEFYPSVFRLVPYPAGNLSWHHLWFVVYLFFFSLILIPAFLYLRKESGKKLLNGLVKVIEKKGGILLLVLPIILSQIILKPIFREETHDLANDWAYFTFNIFFFFYGYLICSDNRFWEIIRNQRRILLIATLLATACLYTVYEIPNEYWPLPPMPLGYRYWWLTTALVAWFSVITTVAYGYQYLNFNRPILKHLNEGIYPFYILHQTVIIIIGFQVLKWKLGILSGFLFVSTASLITCIAIYWFLIKPFNPMRFVFGMKPKKL